MTTTLNTAPSIATFCPFSTPEGRCLLNYPVEAAVPTINDLAIREASEELAEYYQDCDLHRHIW